MSWLFALASLIALVALGCSSSNAVDTDGAGPQALEFIEAWARQPAPGQTNAAVYATVINNGDHDVKILSAFSEEANQAQLHDSVTQDGITTMRHRKDGFTVKAGTTFALEPGGAHIMLMGIDPDTFPNDVIDVTLSFEGDKSAFVSATVRPIK